MSKTNENMKMAAPKVARVPPKRGQIKAKIMATFVKTVEEAGRALCSKEKVAEESQPNHSRH
ncbi:hypothetical protein Lalb_Chr02g0153601 [Lupinus albus]|uniref:Uncharacterized protein n=1 Tax=Lupinus albus TaxID=3870 RepID=A0A6A4QXA5_LUPAL|nr:hypothetical protein Lalb_Chr02g0153601 [Lupinus albus]